MTKAIHRLVVVLRRRCFPWQAFCLGDDVFLWEEVGGALEYHIPRDVSGMVLTRLSVAPKENEASELLGVSRRRF